eukprot:Lithocolla_globosa_v1_NODE_4479_length_1425_cov_2.425547.p2 type:complete len:114 gc:universal NODE_4479_length_1425_cov_2.425547:900-559(-)
MKNFPCRMITLLQQLQYDVILYYPMQNLTPFVPNASVYMWKNGYSGHQSFLSGQEKTTREDQHLLYLVYLANASRGDYRTKKSRRLCLRQVWNDSRKRYRLCESRKKMMKNDC